MTRRKSRLFRPYVREAVRKHDVPPHEECACDSCNEWRRSKIVPGALARVFAPVRLYEKSQRWLYRIGSGAHLTHITHGDMVLVIGDEMSKNDQRRGGIVVHHLASGQIGTVNNGCLVTA